MEEESSIFPTKMTIVEGEVNNLRFDAKFDWTYKAYKVWS